MCLCIGLGCVVGRMEGQTILSSDPYTMPTFEIPTGPAITQTNFAYHGPREEARCTKRRITKPRRGSMAYDCKEGRMMLEWANEAEFLAWLAAEESEKTIELSVSKTLRSDSSDWRERRVLRCLREFTGGKYNYQNKNQWERKIPSKKTGCQCRQSLTFRKEPTVRTALAISQPLKFKLRFFRLFFSLSYFIS